MLPFHTDRLSCEESNLFTYGLRYLLRISKITDSNTIFVDRLHVVKVSNQKGLLEYTGFMQVDLDRRSIVHEVHT